MFFRAVQFLASLAPFLSGDRVLDVAFDMHAIALEEPPLVAGDDEYDARVKSLCVFAAWTSGETAGWDPKAVGDQGSSIGVGQIKPWHALKIAGIDPALVRSDRRESMRAAWRVMRHEILRCGSVTGGLGAYASGTCGGAPVKVRTRLKLAARC